MAVEIVQTTAMPPAIQQVLDREFHVHRLWEASDRNALLKQVAPNVRGMVTSGGVGANRALIEALPRLEMISSFGVGYDSIDIDCAKERGVTVTNTPDVLTDDVADTAMALLLAMMRRIPQGDQFVRQGQWPKAKFPLTDKLGGKKMGVLGLGRIGQAIARRAEPFNVEISYFGPRRKADIPWRYYDNLVAMAKDVDILMIACPGGKETEGLVNQAVIDALGPKGYVVNIARGSVVVEPALVTALVEGKLAGAGLDVFADEPNVPEALWKLDSVTLAPHVGSATHATRQAMGDLVLKNILAFFAGQPVLTKVV
ncbi:2-hydroxyacid dehydrogenase [Ferrovibrio sp.]|jgi:hydroxypyruvate reductase|uniref:2-hydroxyacid dehydrogenase n=1 Tax=Ferrovibrio sp. TaxID=1917215 RepID=UPI0035B125B4